MTMHVLDCFVYCSQVVYVVMLELRVKRVTNSVLMLCKFCLWDRAGEGGEGKERK